MKWKLGKWTPDTGDRWYYYSSDLFTACIDRYGEGWRWAVWYRWVSEAKSEGYEDAQKQGECRSLAVAKFRAHRHILYLCRKQLERVGYLVSEPSEPH
jgi:hypothetical protein